MAHSYTQKHRILLDELYAFQICEKSKNAGDPLKQAWSNRFWYTVVISLLFFYDLYIIVLTEEHGGLKTVLAVGIIVSAYLYLLRILRKTYEEETAPLRRAQELLFSEIRNIFKKYDVESNIDEYTGITEVMIELRNLKNTQGDMSPVTKRDQYEMVAWVWILSVVLPAKFAAELYGYKKVKTA